MRPWRYLPAFLASYIAHSLNNMLILYVVPVFSKSGLKYHRDQPTADIYSTSPNYFSITLKAHNVKSLKDYLKEIEQEKLSSSGAPIFNLVLEHLTYKNIPGTKNSYRLDAGNTNTLTKKHAHVYAKQKGGGSELYSVNIDGSGHDGYSGTQIPKRHADYLTTIGFQIPGNLTLESLSVDRLTTDLFEIFTLKDIEEDIEKPAWTRW